MVCNFDQNGQNKFGFLNFWLIILSITENLHTSEFENIILVIADLFGLIVFLSNNAPLCQSLVYVKSGDGCFKINLEKDGGKKDFSTYKVIWLLPRRWLDLADQTQHCVWLNIYLYTVSFFFRKLSNWLKQKTEKSARGIR